MKTWRSMRRPCGRRPCGRRRSPVKRNLVMPVAVPTYAAVQVGPPAFNVFRRLAKMFERVPGIELSRFGPWYELPPPA